ncbi:MAG: metallophosphoesterase family protein [Acidobacteriaceae bacterium]|jgi:predicted phosphodiesterase
MRALILSDVHANLEALTAALEAADHWDALWNLGDMVGYGASPNEVLELLRPLSTLTVRGNHDRVCCGLGSALHFNPTARAAAEWTERELSAANLEWLRGLPQGPLQVDIPSARGLRAMATGAGHDAARDAGDDAGHEAGHDAGHDAGRCEDGAEVTLAHGSPLDEDDYILNMRDAWLPLQQMKTALTFVGHTHIQGGFWQKEQEWHEIRPRLPGRKERWTLAVPAGTRYLINPGSVGQPRDYDWRAGFAIYDSEECDVTYHRVAYDVRSAQARIKRAGLPDRLAARLREGR